MTKYLTTYAIEFRDDGDSIYEFAKELQEEIKIHLITAEGETIELVSIEKVEDGS